MLRRQSPLILATLGIVVMFAAAGVLVRVHAAPQDFAWVRQSLDIGAYVEQQSSGKSQAQCGVDPTGCIANPSIEDPEPCLWSTDDRDVWYANTGGSSANLASGATASLTECVIADIQLRLNSASVQADTPNLIVTLHFDPQNVTWNLTPLLHGGVYVYDGCVVGPKHNSTDPIVQTIPDSGGGWGVPTTVLFSVTNPTNKTQRHMYGQFEQGSLASGYWRYQACRQPLSDFGVAGGAVWQTGL